MENTKFTTGKWEFIQNTEFPALHEIWSDSESIFTRGTYIARTCFAPASKANALLISKAPEMLEMLADFVETCESGGVVNTDYYVDKFKKLIKEAIEL